ncbi:ABC transporter ATP-binding protein [Faecalicoccus sp.]|uniref:ABC transporter ATP-binding protein n=1 Tax=Faecalicoccus sp. TaxID=1971758 RepID=UPI002A81FA39|nr:ABC transporter ATP-binding protein [Faecalicoccus sp.]MDY5110117.1 ABC transporter ATP-binding protein [Faecalicoccus sp.]
MELRIEHLKKSFEEKEVLKDITFTFQPGKIYGLLGRNGAGKTTLFNCLNQDISVDAGRFFLRDTDAEQPLGMEDIGYVLSTPQVPEFLTAREFLKFFVEINATSIPNKMDLDAYFDLVNLDKEDRDRLLKDFSHGMKNKMQMLINIIASPKVLLLDEPLTSLDVVVAEEMKNILRDLKKDRILILSTHIMELAFDLCDEIVLLSHGKLEEMSEKESEAELKADILRILQEEDHA